MFAGGPAASLHSPQSLNDLTPQELIGLKLSQHLHHGILAALMELTDNVGADGGLAGEHEKKLAAHLDRQLEEGIGIRTTPGGTLRPRPPEFPDRYTPAALPSHRVGRAYRRLSDSLCMPHLTRKSAAWTCS